MAKIERFEDLDCRKAARILVNFVYDLCEREPLSKDYLTKDQIKRASLSTMNNPAEGFGRFSDKEFIRYLEIAQSSGLEVRSMSYLLLDRRYINQYEFVQLQKLANDVINLDNGMIRYLRRKK